MVRALWIAGLLTGCGDGKDEESTDVPEYPDDTQPTGETDTALREDTGGGNGPAAVMEYSAGGWFGYDAVTGAIVPVLNEGEVLPSYFFFEFRSTEYTGSCDSEVCCYVYVELDGYTGEQFALDAGYVFGFHVPQAVATGYSSCLDNGFDPEDPAWYGGDPFETWSDAGIGVGVLLGGDPSSTVTEWTDSDPYQQIIGGQFVPFDDAGESTLYFEAWAVDGAFEILDETRLSRTDFTDAYGALVTGFYQFDVMVHFDL